MSFIDMKISDNCTMLERQAAAFGYMPNYAKPFSHNPELMELWSNLLNGIKYTMNKRLFDLVNFAAALELHSSYCSLVFGKRLLKYFSESEVIQMAGFDFQGTVSTAEAAAMQYARTVARNASEVSEFQIRFLQNNGFNDEAILNIAAAASARAFFSKIVDGVGTQPDHQFTEMAADLRDTLEVGRKIATSR